MTDDLFSQLSPKDVPKKETVVDRKVGFQSVGTLFDKFKIKDKGGYITQEFQDFGYRMAVELDDLARTSLYMRLAKRENRGILEQALSFVSDANAKNKARLFMWKVKQIKEEKKDHEK
ncbi:MAG: hypothetical protein COU63_03760 [Candidatus Pacebacteria bacterium CG10_big_fil_rev_8_21_14_0_10_36_11]|nr:hypothetical protein [Candidatus Pacearchaeota archaeon]OIP73859.1 MAG: hypothetical protein AUK08_04870 [Candidatus Pacebacteria bacterium CG2_30_36_39]PIR64578.1 MAG: hypothetical protein COU63_03760 [Candidatus Pacebacteria bacterium CG10_big_fil_rev_8_21_14_0_10_36_11]PJC43001.1 MAG: hypothetical protein CO040_01520 [Candidatus Pacebacteria bacterium CG_4_9_14_0_2_um_filter_36_8]